MVLGTYSTCRAATFTQLKKPPSEMREFCMKIIAITVHVQ
jgi:hypothetical protein